MSPLTKWLTCRLPDRLNFQKPAGSARSRSHFRSPALDFPRPGLNNRTAELVS